MHYNPRIQLLSGNTRGDWHQWVPEPKAEVWKPESKAADPFQLVAYDTMLIWKDQRMRRRTSEKGEPDGNLSQYKYQILCPTCWIELPLLDDKISEFCLIIKTAELSPGLKGCIHPKCSF